MGNKKMFLIAQRRINALTHLLVFYRIGKKPTCKLLDQLDSSEIAWERIEKEMGL